MPDSALTIGITQERYKQLLEGSPVGSTTLTISCHSSEEKLCHMFRSIIRVLTQVSGLQHHWEFCDPLHPSLNVRILDLDDEQIRQTAHQYADALVMVISSQAEHLQGWTYALSKPLRSQALLDILQRIERRAMPPAPVRPSEPTPAPQRTPEPSPPLPTAASRPVADPRVQPVYGLQNWPDLTQLPEAQMLNAARVCALLSLRPAGADWISQFLSLARADLEALLVLIRQCGHPGHPVLTEGLQRMDALQLPEPSPEAQRPSTFLAKIWNRLKGVA